MFLHPKHDTKLRKLESDSRTNPATEEYVGYQIQVLQ